MPPSRCTLAKGQLLELLKQHVPSLKDQAFLNNDLEAVEHYEEFLVACARDTVRLRVGDVEDAARSLYPEAGPLHHRAFAQRVASALGVAQAKARHCTTGTAVHPPAMQRLVAALMGSASSSSGSSSMPSRSRPSQGGTKRPLAVGSRASDMTEQEAEALWGLPPKVRKPLLPEVDSGPISIVSSQEVVDESEGGEDSGAEEGELGDGEEEAMEVDAAVAGPVGGPPQQQKQEQELEREQQPQQQQLGEQEPQQRKEVCYPDVARKVLVVITAEGSKLEFGLLPGPEGMCVIERAGTRLPTEVPNLFLEPPVLKRPAAAKRVGSKRKGKKGIQVEDEGEVPLAEAPEPGDGQGGEAPRADSAEEGEAYEASGEEGLAEGIDEEVVQGGVAEGTGEEEEAEAPANRQEVSAEAGASGGPEPEVGGPMRPPPPAPGRRYQVMWYREPRGALALRQCFGPKRQVFQIVASSAGTSREVLEALYERLIVELQAGTCQEAEARAWVRRELLKLQGR